METGEVSGERELENTSVDRKKGVERALKESGISASTSTQERQRDE